MTPSPWMKVIWSRAMRMAISRAAPTSRRYAATTVETSLRKSRFSASLRAAVRLACSASRCAFTCAIAASTSSCWPVAKSNAMTDILNAAPMLTTLISTIMRLNGVPK